MPEIIRAFCSITLFILRADAGEDISPGWQVRHECGVPACSHQELCGRSAPGRVDLLQAVGAVFMYRTLTNPKLLRGLTHSGFMFDDIICDFYCPLLNIIFHKNNPCINCFLQSMQGHFDVCLHFPFERRGSPAKKSHSPSP